MVVSAKHVDGTVFSDGGSSRWLRSRRWDLIFITLSVVVVPLPYFVYLLGVSFFDLQDDVSRNAVNGFVAVAVGGPHMMSTFLRTGLDNSFRQRYPMLVRSSLVIPVVVVSLAFLNLSLLLTVFFFWASLHVLHQVTYIVELYNHKEVTFFSPGRALDFRGRAAEYAVVMTCLFPVAAYKISKGSFDIGTNDLASVIPDFFENMWFFVLLSGVFFVAVVAYLYKVVMEYREGTINWPKTVFIMFTVFVAFTIPALPNLDTAFQGLNTWHSFQYLAITFYIIRIRQLYGSLDQTAPLVARFGSGARSLYLLSALMLVGSAVLFVVVYFVAHLVDPVGVDVVDARLVANWRFDVAYYTAILSFLWIHYYHDHFLFMDFEVLDDVSV